MTCDSCHDTGNYPNFADSKDLDNTNVCDTCHSPGGAFDGVAMARSYWGAGAYQEPDDLGREHPQDDFWCASCHDQETSRVAGTTILVDDFEAYGDDKSLQDNWESYDDDAGALILEPQDTGVTGPDGSQCMRACIEWTKTTARYGTVGRRYDPNIDLTEMDSFNFYVRVDKTDRIESIKVGLQKSEDNKFCVATLTASELQDNTWKQVSFPRSRFTDTTWGKVRQILFRIVEYDPNDQEHTQNVYFDNITFSGTATAPNVIGDNQTWGYYVTGHKIYCTFCHDSTSAHIDGQSHPILEYIRNTPNPTNFRFYEGLGMELPYSQEYATEKFALCYRCHYESWIMENAIGTNPNLMTNFRDDSDSIPGAKQHNLHRYHLDDFGATGPTTCVFCHDPHGQSYPAMNRKETGELVYLAGPPESTEDWCQIPDRVTDTNGNAIPDWYDPAINYYGAMTVSQWDGTFCTACHVNGLCVGGQCEGGSDKYTTQCGPLPALSAYYFREYKQLRHTGGKACSDPGCH